MGFWIFMLITTLFVPVIMILFGTYFYKNAPKEINNTFGYRTNRSMKNRDTWEFAHHYCGKVWVIMGCIILVFSVAAMLFCINRSMRFVAYYGLVVASIQCVFLVASIFPVETALKKNFDNDGNHKK